MTNLSTQQLAQSVAVLRKLGDSTDIYDTILDLLRSVVDFDAATLFEAHPKTKTLTVIHQFGETKVDLVTETEFDAGTGLSAWITNQTEPVILESIPKSRAGKAYQINSFVALPLWVDDQFLGVLNFSHHESGKYSMELKPDFQIVAHQLAMAMERIRLQDRVHAQNEQLRKTLKQLQDAQKQLVEKERLAAVGEVVVTVNHEINNPLTSIMGATELAQTMLELDQTEKVERYLNMIIEGANRIKSITEKISALKNTRSVPYVDNYTMLEIHSE